MPFRTDLAVEAEGIDRNLAGLYREDHRVGAARIQVMEITTAQAAEQLGRELGRYVTLEMPRLTDNDRALKTYADLLAQQLRQMLPETGCVLVVGLGNRRITPDAIGPLTADRVLATRHIRGELARSAGLDDLRPTAVIAPGVTGQTGAEVVEVVKALCRELAATAVIAVDALAARSLARLGCTVQLCDAGIAPGSGVGNNRKALNRALLGVPVIGMGIPSVVDAKTLAVELTGCYDEELLEPAGEAMMITPREIDLLVKRGARLMALAINGALQPDYEPLELVALSEA